MSAISCRARRSTRIRRGVAAVFVAISITTLLLCASLAVDVGYILALRVEQQNNADAGALAGASGLQSDEPRLAYHRALSIIARNQKRQGYVSMEDQLIEFGTWSTTENRFTPVDDINNAFAIRVRAARTKAPLFFAAIIGRNYTTVRRMAVAVGSRPCAGAWGINGVTAGGIYTDSFNSDDGPYDPATAGDEGDLCSGRAIDVHGSFEINGDVMAGFGYEVNVSGSAGEIDGLTTLSVLSPFAIPPVDVEDRQFVNDNALIGLTDDGRSPWKGGGWNMAYQGTDNLSLVPGTYYLDSFKIAGGSTLTITGTTTIYLAGSWDSTGGVVVNTAQDPADFTIMSAGTDMKMSGGTDFYGSIMAPSADIVFSGGAAIYGAVIGGTLKLSGDMEFHLDKSLPLAQPLFEPPMPFLVR